MTWYHPCLKTRNDLEELDQKVFVLYQDSKQSVLLKNVKMFYSFIDNRAVGMNFLMHYLMSKYYWVVVFHPKVQVSPDKIQFPDYSRVFYSAGEDWQNLPKEFSSMHFSYILRTYDYLPWNTSKTDAESLAEYIKSIKVSNLSKQINPYWKLIL